uniref:Putative ovule protein n=1 Tax=Solanum chacoense TaxID=4108 RepID=A0A0V0GIY7_SOLCH
MFHQSNEIPKLTHILNKPYHLLNDQIQLLCSFYSPNSTHPLVTIFMSKCVIFCTDVIEIEKDEMG